MYARTALKSLEDYKGYIGDRGPVFANPDAKKLCVSIASVRREKVKYLEQAVASLLTRTPLSYQDRVQMTLYNLDVPASKHTAAKSLSPLIRVEDASYLSVDPNAGEISRDKILTKEYLDYITILSEEEKRGCEHYLVLEDDCLASKNWVKTVMDIIQQVEKHGANYCNVKLFNVTAYENGRWFWFKPLDVLLITVVSLAATAIIYGSMIAIAKLIIRFRGTNDQDYLKNSNGTGIWGHFSKFDRKSALFLLVCCVSFVIFIDRKSFVGPLKNGLNPTKIGLQTVAILYTKESLSRWNKFLRLTYRKAKISNIRIRPKDTYVADFKNNERVNGKNMVQMVYQPSVFQHTGIQSSVGHDLSYNNANLSLTFPDDDAPIDFDKNFIES